MYIAHGDPPRSNLAKTTGPLTSSLPIHPATTSTSGHLHLPLRIPILSICPLRSLRSLPDCPPYRPVLSCLCAPSAIETPRNCPLSHRQHRPTAPSPSSAQSASSELLPTAAPSAATTPANRSAPAAPPAPERAPGAAPSMSPPRARPLHCPPPRWPDACPANAPYMIALHRPAEVLAARG
jgi:hypothetical protein